MAESVPQGLLLPEQVAHEVAARRSPNGIAFAAFGDTELAQQDLDRLVGAVPTGIAGQIGRSAYFFVPLALARQQHGVAEPAADDETLVSPTFSTELSERATCHRNVILGETDAVFISTRLLSDRFALSFEFFIHVGHAFSDAVPTPTEFADLVWSQAEHNVRGETSQDAWEARALARGTSTAHPDQPHPTPAAARTATAEAPTATSPETLRSDFLSAAFADSIAIYLLSLSVDFDYSELREREYPLLAPQALAERLRLVASLYPPNLGYEFAIRYRRRA